MKNIQIQEVKILVQVLSGMTELGSKNENVVALCADLIVFKI
jgi:hypothetical protein